MGRGKHRGPKGPKSLSVPVPPAPAPYEVHMTASAEQVYLDLKLKSDAALARGDAGNQHCTTFRAVDDSIRRIIPADPTHRKYALHKPLDAFYRIAKGRLRIAWTVDTDRRALLIVFISTELRKEGDAQDPYVILNAMAKAGHLDKIVQDWRQALYVPPDSPLN